MSQYPDSRCGGRAHLLDRVEDVRLAVTVAVRANTEVDFAGILVRLEGLRDTCSDTV